MRFGDAADRASITTARCWNYRSRLQEEQLREDRERRASGLEVFEF